MFSAEFNSHISALIWTVMLASAAIVITLPRESGIRVLVASTILRLIMSIGPEPTLWILCFLTVKTLYTSYCNYLLYISAVLLTCNCTLVADCIKSCTSYKYYR